MSELLERVKARALGARSTRTCPSSRWWRSCKPPRSLAHSPLFQVMFAWQNNEAVELEAPGLDDVCPPCAAGYLKI